MRCPFSKQECSHYIMEAKKPFGEEGKVFLTDKEVAALIKRFTQEGFNELVERLNDYILQIGDKSASRYKSHAATIRNWARRDNGSKFTPKQTTLQTKMEAWAKEGRLLNKDSMGEDLFKFAYAYLVEHKMKWPEYCHKVVYCIPIDEPLKEVDFKSKAAGE